MQRMNAQRFLSTSLESYFKLQLVYSNTSIIIIRTLYVSNINTDCVAKTRLILDEMCCLYGKFTSYLRRVLCKTRLIFSYFFTRLVFSRVNGPNVSYPSKSPRAN